MAEAPSSDLVEQKIAKQVTVANGATGSVAINIPDNREVWLKGYGHTFSASSSFKLRTGNKSFPARTDQEGSPSIPVQYGRPFKVRPGGDNLSLTITNGSGASVTYNVVFYILTNELLDITSEGGELVLTTGSTGGGATNLVAVSNTAGTNQAGVTTAFGLEVDPVPPAAIQAGTVSTAGAAAVALGASAALKRGVLVKADLANGAENVLVGNSSDQYVALEAGDSIFIDIDDIDAVYIKRSGSTNVTANFVGS